jgi:hypothetical protein
LNYAWQKGRTVPLTTQAEELQTALMINVIILPTYVCAYVGKIIILINQYTRYEHKNIKGKAIPLQAWGGPEGSRRLRLPDFKTIDT